MRYERPYRRYQRTARTMISGGNRKPGGCRARHCGYRTRTARDHPATFTAHRDPAPMQQSRCQTASGPSRPPRTTARSVGSLPAVSRFTVGQSRLSSMARHAPTTVRPSSWMPRSCARVRTTSRSRAGTPIRSSTTRCSQPSEPRLRLLRRRLALTARASGRATTPTRVPAAVSEKPQLPLLKLLLNVAPRVPVADDLVVAIRYHYEEVQ